MGDEGDGWDVQCTPYCFHDGFVQILNDSQTNAQREGGEFVWPQTRR